MDVMAVRHFSEYLVCSVFGSCRADVEGPHRAHHRGSQQKSIFYLKSCRMHEIRSHYPSFPGYGAFATEAGLVQVRRPPGEQPPLLSGSTEVDRWKDDEVARKLLKC